MQAIEEAFWRLLLTTLVGSMMPFLIIALLDLTFGLLVAKLVFGLPFRGNILTLYAFTSAT